MEENGVKTILFTLAYLTLIRLPFSISTGISLPSGQCYDARKKIAKISPKTTRESRDCFCCFCLFHGLIRLNLVYL